MPILFNDVCIGLFKVRPHQLWWHIVQIRPLRVNRIAVEFLVNVKGLFGAWGKKDEKVSDFCFGYLKKIVKKS